MLVRSAFIDGSSRLLSVALGTLSNAELVGAKTVNGPGPESVAPRSAAVTAATSVVSVDASTAFSTRLLVGSIMAPPTITPAPPELMEPSAFMVVEQPPKVRAAARARAGRKRVIIIGGGMGHDPRRRPRGVRPKAWFRKDLTAPQAPVLRGRGEQTRGVAGAATGAPARAA